MFFVKFEQPFCTVYFSEKLRKPKKNYKNCEVNDNCKLNHQHFQRN